MFSRARSLSLPLPDRAPKERACGERRDVLAIAAYTQSYGLLVSMDCNRRLGL